MRVMTLAPLHETCDLDDIRDFLVSPTRQGQMTVEQVAGLDEQTLRRSAELLGEGFVEWMVGRKGRSK